MAASQNGIEKQRVDIGLEVSAVHLDGEFITKNESNGKSIVFIVIAFLTLGINYDLFKAYKVLIGDRESDIRDNLDTMRNEFLSTRAPNRLTIIFLIGCYDLMNS